MADAPGPVAHLLEGGTQLAHPLAVALVRLGRDPLICEILVRDATVSRLHAEVRTTGARRVLTVRGSTGARVNDFRVTAPVTLSHGDRLEIGQRSYQYHEGELPLGFTSYVGHGHDAQQDPLLSRTTQSNPVIAPGDAARWLKEGRDTSGKWATVAVVVAAFALGFWFYARL